MKKKCHIKDNLPLATLKKTHHGTLKITYLATINNRFKALFLFWTKELFPCLTKAILKTTLPCHTKDDPPPLKVSLRQHKKVAILHL